MSVRKANLFALITALILSLTACGGEPFRPTVVGTPFPEHEIVPLPSKNPLTPPPEYPVIDGSSSTVWMHMAIRSYLTDMRVYLSHSQTYAALERLVPGHEDPADVVLAVKYYDDTLQDVKDRGADLVVTPIAKEGFVFIIHKDNPVNSLTQQQLRDIYSGRIINWKEVGGNDAVIYPYTRNWDSGSQTAMADFMGDLPINAIEEMNPILSMASMSMMLDSVYTNPNAIGYNIFSWTTVQGSHRDGVKTVAVDGVEPSNGTLADGSYPLIVYTYSYYNNGNGKGRDLTGWLLTEEGQKVIASAGYVGIGGELPYHPGVDYGEDEWKAQDVLSAYYNERKELFKDYFWGELVQDRKQTEAFSGGKGKDVTVMFIVRSGWDETADDFLQTRFIVLTREIGGEFEVINEGEV